MPIPSAKTIAATFPDLETDQVKAIRKAMEDAYTVYEIDDALEAINDIIGGYGVESTRDDGWDRYYCDIGLLYVNTGDTYSATVMYDTRKELWKVGTWGDYIERNMKRFSP